MNIVQIGTCIANDDLTNLIGKKQPDKLILVEPLSIHNNQINECYNWVENIYIENIAISITNIIEMSDSDYKDFSSKD
jgi:hypothetical protein